MSTSEVPEIPGVRADEPMAREFRQEVANLLNSRNYSQFPGAQPVSFQRKHLQELCDQDYFLCEKTDGLRCLLYCTIDGDQEIHYMIDRKNDYFFVPHLHFPHHTDPDFQKFHKDTILDGELVWDKIPGGQKRLRFMVFDLILLDGEVLSQKTFDKRIGRYMEFIQKPLDKMFKRFPGAREEFPFEIMMKQMEKPYALDDMFLNKLPNLAHGNDGLVFTAKACLYKYGTDEMILKWKPPNENTLDFKILLGEFPIFDPDDGGPPDEDWDAKPEIHLLVYFGDKGGRADYRKFTSLYLTDEEWEAIKMRDEQIDGRIVECHLDETLGRWRPKLEADGAPRFRDDKNTANHISTVNKVLESIEDGVTEEELRNAASRIMRAWKNRHPEEDRHKLNGH